MTEVKDSLGNLKDIVPQPYHPKEYTPDPREKPTTIVLRRLRRISDKTLKQSGMLEDPGKVKYFRP